MQIYNYYIAIEGTIFPKPKKKEGKGIRRCTRCIMDDSSDDTIIFDDNGRCNYCTAALNNIGRWYFPNSQLIIRPCVNANSRASVRIDFQLRGCMQCLQN